MNGALGRLVWPAGALILFSLVAPSLAGCAGSPGGPEPPRLVVLLVIDQFRPDYFERFEDRFGEDGFKRLLRGGAVFTHCRYPYGITETAPGHATLATGTTPDRHGIIGNYLVDEETGRVVAAVHDLSSPVLGGTVESVPASPRRLRVPTLGDALVQSSGGEAKVFGVALKNRSAILSVGRKAAVAYWYDEFIGRFVTSRAFREELPDWVARFNRESGSESYYARPWRGGGTTFSELTSPGGKPDRDFFKKVRRTPHGNQMVLEFAQALVRQEGLGRDEVTDILFIGFSANDLAGHDWGPFSPAVEDMTVQTDRQVAALLAWLDEEIGEGNWWLALASDHGVAPTVEQAQERGLPGKALRSSDARAAVEGALTARWGEGPWLLPHEYQIQLVFSREALARHGASLQEASRVAGLAATKVEGVRGYFSATSSNLPPELAARYRLGHYPGRSPDVVLVPDPYAIRDPWKDAAQHGSPYDYDRHVPLIFFGPPFRPGEYDDPVAPTDLIPTLAAALGMEPPATATGRVLEQALRGTGGDHRAPAENPE